MSKKARLFQHEKLDPVDPTDPADDSDDDEPPSPSRVEWFGPNTTPVTTVTAIKNTAPHLFIFSFFIFYSFVIKSIFKLKKTYLKKRTKGIEVIEVHFH
jgi:hypothetical protein